MVYFGCDGFHTFGRTMHIESRNKTHLKNSLLIPVTVIIFLCTFFILFVFQPFGDISHGFTLIGTTRMLSYALTASSIFFLMEHFMKQWYFSKIFTDKPHTQQLTWLFVRLWAIGIGIFICKSFWLGDFTFSFPSFFNVFYRVIAIATIPTVLISLIYLNAKRNKGTAAWVILKSADKNPDFLKVPTKEMLYLKSEDNYTKICYLEQGKLSNSLLRGSLTYFSSQLGDSCLRIHQSTIVNLHAITSVTLNSQGGIVILKEAPLQLKISRSYVVAFRAKWDDFQKTM